MCSIPCFRLLFVVVAVVTKVFRGKTYHAANMNGRRNVSLLRLHVFPSVEKLIF